MAGGSGPGQQDRMCKRPTANEETTPPRNRDGVVFSAAGGGANQPILLADSASEVGAEGAAAAPRFARSLAPSSASTLVQYWMARSLMPGLWTPPTAPVMVSRNRALAASS